LLLLLDNCEHLVAVCAELVEALLQACPDLRVVATSREPLGCEGEWLYRVPSLSLPPGEGVRCLAFGVEKIGGAVTPDAECPTPEGLTQYEAIRLFVERAAAAQPAFAVTAANAPMVVQICRRLDGI